MKILTLIIGFIVIQIIIWALILFWLKQRLVLEIKQQKEFIYKRGETILFGPASGNYTGSETKFSRVRGNGVICVTNRYVFFQKLIGENIEVPLSDIVNVTEETWFKGRLAIGKDMKHLVIHTRDRNKIGFLVKNSGLWKNIILNQLSYQAEQLKIFLDTK